MLNDRSFELHLIEVYPIEVHLIGKGAKEVSGLLPFFILILYRTSITMGSEPVFLCVIQWQHVVFPLEDFLIFRFE